MSADPFRNYDAWLERPYQRRYSEPEPPADVEDLLDERVWLEREDSWARVENAEPWEDEDEDGRYGGWDLVLRLEDSDRTITLSLAETQEAWEGSPR